MSVDGNISSETVNSDPPRGGVVIRGGDSLAAVCGVNASKRRRVEHHSFGEGDCSWRVEASQGLMTDSKQTDMLVEELGLPQMPEMVFLDNTVSLSFKGEERIRFSAKDALATVSLIPDPNVKVAATSKWREARKDSEYIDRETLKFDWTFTPDYSGTFSNIPPHKIRDVEHEWEVINVEKLTRRDPILFFQDLILFEDELSDNGCAMLNVKLRAMKTCFLLLLRFYLRVDDVMVRVIDSRFYTEPSWSVIVWEHTKREASIPELRAQDIGYSEITRPDEISPKLTVLSQKTQVIELN